MVTLRDDPTYAAERQKLADLRREVQDLRAEEGEIYSRRQQAVGSEELERVAVAVLDGERAPELGDGGDVRLREIGHRLRVLKRACEVQEVRLGTAASEAKGRLRGELEAEAKPIRDRLVKAFATFALAAQEAEEFRDPLIRAEIHPWGLMPPFPYRTYRLDISPTDFSKVVTWLKDARELDPDVDRLVREARKDWEAGR